MQLRVESLVARVKKQARTAFRRRVRGAMLVEVLVALTLMAFALLTLITVHAAALRYAKMSQYQTTATWLAVDMGERMRANKGLPVKFGISGGFLGGDYDYARTFQSQQGAVVLPGEPCNHPASVCTATQMAAMDLAQWRRLVRSQLPEGAVFMLRRPVEVAMDIWVAWRDPVVASADENPALPAECPEGLGRGGDLSIRCSYFRVKL